MMMIWPWWLALAVPLGLLLWLWRGRRRLLTVLRFLVLALAVLALTEPHILLPRRAGVVVVVADRSHSMPPAAERQQAEAVRLLIADMGADQELAVVPFGESWSVEHFSGQSQFEGLSKSQVGGDASNLAEAVDAAMSIIGSGRPGRILLLSDGLWTGRDPVSSAARAASAGVAIDHRLIQRSAGDDVAIERFEGPQSVAPGEGILLAAHVSSPRAQQARYELVRQGQVIASGSTMLASGGNRLLLRDLAGDAGTLDYTLRVMTDHEDAVPENNTARYMLRVQGPRGLLLVSDRRQSGLADLLRAGGLDVEVCGPEDAGWTLERLSNYSAVILENVPANQIRSAGLETLASWVSHAGGGLMMTGGRQSFGTGGYMKSPLERVLPVTMELRQEHRKFSLAIVVVLDRSGSMTMPVQGGKSKMDLANLATAEVVRMLSPMDQFGCLAVDTSPHVIVDLTQVTRPDELADRVLKIQSMGGGIFVYEGLAAAARMISGSSAGGRHIVLFSDAADSEQPGDYKNLIAKLRQAGVTISVIALGTEKDVDADLLKDIAKRGEGRCIFTESAAELPQLFVQDTLLVARSAFVDEATAVRATAAMSVLTPEHLGELPNVGGYNLCYARPEAYLAALTLDDQQAPLVAAWQVGSGRVACYTGEADGEFSGDIATWAGVGRFFGSLARWSANQDNELKGDVAVTQSVDRGMYTIRLHLSPQRDKAPFASLPQLVTLHARPGHSPHHKVTQLRWVSADLLEAEVPLVSDETVLGRLNAWEAGEVTLSPVCLPQSPEFAVSRGRDGGRSLEQLSRATGGVERIDLAGIWQALPENATRVPIGQLLALAAVLLLLADVAERRMGLLSQTGGGLRAGWSMGRRVAGRLRPKFVRRTKGLRKNIASVDSRVTPPDGDAVQEGREEAAGGPAVASSDMGPPNTKAGGPGMQDALSKARTRAGNRIKR